MTVDAIGTSQIQAQTRPVARADRPRFEGPIEPIRPYGQPSRDAATQDAPQGAQTRDETTAARRNTEAASPATRFSLDGQIPAETISPTAVADESFSGMAVDVIAQEVGSTLSAAERAGVGGPSPASGGARALSRSKGADLYATVQQIGARPTSRTHDSHEYWSDGLISARRVPVNLYA